MIKYAQIVNEETKQVNVGIGTDEEFYKSLGMTKMNVEQAWNGSWYIEGYVPPEPEESLQEKLTELEEKYNMPRVIREGILGNPNMYSEFNVKKAKELEEIAKSIRTRNK